MKSGERGVISRTTYADGEIHNGKLETFECAATKIVNLIDKFHTHDISTLYNQVYSARAITLELLWTGFSKELDSYYNPKKKTIKCQTH